MINSRDLGKMASHSNECNNTLIAMYAIASVGVCSYIGIAMAYIPYVRFFITFTSVCCLLDFC